MRISIYSGTHLPPYWQKTSALCFDFGAPAPRSGCCSSAGAMKRPIDGIATRAPAATRREREEHTPEGPDGKARPEDRPGNSGVQIIGIGEFFGAVARD